MVDVRGALLKMDRALEHLQFINAKMAEFVEANLNFVTRQVKDDRGDEWDVVIWTGGENPDERFGVWLGDFVHNVRSALDFCVYSTVMQTSEKDAGEHTQFPIYDGRDRWIKDVEKRDAARWPRSPILGILHDSPEFAIIEKAQPYHGHNQKERLRHPLYELLRMSNIDKHQKLHVARANTSRPRITYEPRGFYKIAKAKWAPEPATWSGPMGIDRYRAGLSSVDK